MNKVLVKIYVPIIDEQYDIWIPLNKTIYNIIILLSKGINELEDGIYQPNDVPILYNRATGKEYELDVYVNDTDIVNGSELVLI